MCDGRCFDYCFVLLFWYSRKKVTSNWPHFNTKVVSWCCIWNSTQVAFLPYSHTCQPHDDVKPLRIWQNVNFDIPRNNSGVKSRGITIRGYFFFLSATLAWRVETIVLFIPIAKLHNNCWRGGQKPSKMSVIRGRRQKLGKLWPQRSYKFQFGSAWK